MNGIPSDLYQRLQAALLRCPAFESDRALRALFVDEHLAPWHDALPEADSRVARVQAAIDRLSQATHANGDNALELLLRVLSENTPEGDRLRDELAALANETAQALADSLRIMLDATQQQLTASPLTAALVEQMLAPLRAQLAAVEARLAAQQRANVEEPCPDPADVLACYLKRVIDENGRLQLQGIRSASGLVSIELEEVYVTLTTTVRKTVTDEEAWVEEMAKRAPGERPDRFSKPVRSVEQVKVQIQEALAMHPRLVVLGDPGSGKTTLLRYLALTFARDFLSTDLTDATDWGKNPLKSVQSVDTSLVKQRLGLDERRLPILLPLRDFARYLEKECSDVGADGPKMLLDYLRLYFANQNLALPADFFETRLKAGECLALFDGVDEVASMATRQRIVRILERFTLAYPQNRYVVTSRIVGYTAGARLGADYAVTTVRDFTNDDIERFARHWNRAVEIVLAGGATDYALRKGETEAKKLIEAIKSNARVRELAVNPLLLTVIALVQRYRAQLPDRRVELYEEALEVLLVQWDAVKGLEEADIAVLQDLKLDAGDRRSLLEPIALWLMEHHAREIELDDLRRQLAQPFYGMLKDWRLAAKAVDGFIALINARSGLLTERGQGLYAFSHLTFQEHLAARAIADRADNVSYTLARLGDSWWREVVLLEAGYLSTQGKRRATELIRAIMEHQPEPEPYHNLVLAAEAVRDVGQARTEGDLAGEIQAHLRKAFETPLKKGADLKMLVQRRAAAAEALGKIESGGYGAQPAFWTLPYGEPVWVEIPAGEFSMGTTKEQAVALSRQYSGWDFDIETPQHKVRLESYWIAKVPITNAQYRLFVEATRQSAPRHWENGAVPRGLESHPVVNVTWHEAMAYCRWLSEVTGKSVTLPSEAEWEKAARGAVDKREYPWGDTWKEGYCNSSELGVGGTTPVGIFPEGASLDGCLDMVGNVWEWTRSLWGKDWQKPDFKYPYRDEKKRENLEAGDEILRVLRGGSFRDIRDFARCAFRYWNLPNLRYDYFGFRVVVSLSHA
ncbi:MAG TPA: SUMF1/EgtB/PvdO family nonheme iron enzyme [Anaerolineae bacterium]|nr:SUMF1/EgtB/PvdO family nonheme iron enzyme [Anaerolineae bacterium]HQI84323.1 SUMF1/EgtB/PvdO family nonheme iron enzyme [Anaerolineae bacterium]